MTAQINDTCFHQKIDFNFAGISGTGLFEPAAVGIEPFATSTACWRGYVGHYSILDGELFLTSLDLGLSPQNAIRARAGKGPELFGVLPTAAEYAGFTYKGFKTPMTFTGGLLLADDFIPELYVHMGFHPAWKYKNVREVIFEKGSLTKDMDRSSDMAAARAKFTDEKNCFIEPSYSHMRSLMSKCFSREY